MEEFDNFIGLTDRNIQDTASVFSLRTTAQGRINFGMLRMDYTLGIIHWAQDESR